MVITVDAVTVTDVGVIIVVVAVVVAAVVCELPPLGEPVSVCGA